MKNLKILPSLAFWLNLLIVSGPLHAALSDPYTTIELGSTVHILAPDESDVGVTPGSYTVEPAEEWIRLVPGERRDAVLIEAERRTHPLDIDYPLAMAFPGDSQEETDLHFVMLLLPEGQSLEATGTFSGIRPRGLLGNAFNKAKKTANNDYNQAKSTANQAANSAANAAQQAPQQTQQAASTVQKGLQGAQAAALQARRAVEQQARQVCRTIGGGAQTQITNIQNNPLVAKLESEIQPLEAVRKLNLEPLIILVSTHTEDTRKALERYNRSVLQLAEAASR